MWEKITKYCDGYKFYGPYPNKKEQFEIIIYFDKIINSYRVRCPEFELKTTSLKTNDEKEAKTKALELIIARIETKEKLYSMFKTTLLSVKTK